MQLTVTFYVDQTIRGKAISTRFTDEKAANVYASSVGGVVRLPKETTTFGEALAGVLKGVRNA